MITPENSPDDSPNNSSEADVETKLILRNLTCSRNERVLFQSINLSLRAGEVLFLEGENGSGKTSLLRIICGFRFQDEGEIIWGNSRVKDKSAYLENISYIGHKNGIKDELTVEENLLHMRSMMPVSEIKTEQVLKHMGLVKQADVLTRQLSAGQKRKLALSRLLLSKAAFWVLDEPFTSLDRASVVFFEGVIKKHVKSGGMLILTSHHDIDLSGLSVNRFNLSV